MSHDGLHGITIIAFIGSVFSPYYAWSGRKDPQNHVALNVALYGKGPKRWAMTERGRNALTQTPDKLTIGPSSVTWEDGKLVIQIEERAVPHLTPIRGTVTVTPTLPAGKQTELTPGGAHVWHCLAPAADISVDLERPQSNGKRHHWAGHGYIDTNAGSRPVERDFIRWDWSRCGLSQDRAAVLYDMVLVDGREHSLGYLFDKTGMSDFTPPPRQSLGKGLWLVDRWTQCDEGRTPSTSERLEEAPFYTRSFINTNVLGENVKAMHETLDCRRLDTNWVKCLLPFRMPRRT